jgi:hypothetical protein
MQVMVSRAVPRFQRRSVALNPFASRREPQKEVHATSAAMPAVADVVASIESTVRMAGPSMTPSPETGFVSVVCLRFCLHACPSSAAQPESVKCKPSSSCLPGFCQECGPTLRSRRSPTASHQARATGWRIIRRAGLASRRRSHLTSNVRPHTKQLFVLDRLRHAAQFEEASYNHENR